MINSIQSDDDFFAWLDYLSLPADGWDGDGEPPEVSLTAAVDLQPNYFSPLDGVMGVAYADRKKKGVVKRVTSKAFAGLLNKLGKLLRNGDEAAGNKKLIEGIKGATSVAKKTKNNSLRKAAFVPHWVATGMYLGKKFMNQLVGKAKNLRMSPMAIAATIMYLQSRNVETCDASFGQYCRPLTKQIRNELPKLYSKSVFSFLTNKESVYALPKHSGYLFHLTMLAVNHLNYEIAGGKRPIAAEFTSRPQLIIEKNGVNVNYGKPYIRYVDIVLAGENETTPNKNSIYVETKSYSKTKNVGGYWKKWDLTRGDKLKAERKNHRQFYLDRVSTSVQIVNKKERPKTAENFEWWFQDFKRKGTNSKQSYDEADLKTVSQYASKLPNKSNDIGAISVGFKDKQTHNNTYTKSDARKHLNLFNVKTWLIEGTGNNLLEGVDDDLVEELINLNGQF